MKRKISALLLCLGMVASLLMIPAGAANVCKAEEISGDTSATVEFFVTAKSGWSLWGDSVKLTQSKGKLCRDAWDGEKTEDTWGYFRVKVYKQSGSDYEYVKGYDWEDEKQSVSGLERGKTYKIVVAPYSIDALADAHPIKYSAYRGLRNANCGTMYWETQAKWTVTSTSTGVNSCSWSK